MSIEGEGKKTKNKKTWWVLLPLYSRLIFSVFAIEAHRNDGNAVAPGIVTTELLSVIPLFTVKK